MESKKQTIEIKSISTEELLNGQTYKAPIWKIVFKPSWTIVLRLLLAYILSFIFNSVDMLSGTGLWLGILTIEIIYYNYISDEKNRP